jgi:hypothetical protein
MNERVSIRSAWNESMFILKGPLTDRAISRYQKRGVYSQEMRAKRREIQERKWAKKGYIREGQFLVDKNGNKIYSPV